ncbi:MAG: 3-deoxy-D-manno-octulosonic acid transferase [Armatimonadota bacterium]|nr:3-deoxy-D-manno-octulosonic acid transferase [Armatimonadota bacterium]MCX7777462.1 3-deoxy-D-manno-octulosonic acid transferase [Armatimonadota bacterium]MDW8025529.1 3-deoxy-D-manno-octulosonic acid transferase [Armatimonadota bacterium]
MPKLGEETQSGMQGNGSSLIYAIYNMALNGATPVIALYIVYRLLVMRKGLGAVRNWFGDMPKPGSNGKTKRLWVHAVSVGEVMVAQALIKMLRQLIQDAWMVLTTVTDTGNIVAKRLASEVDAVAYLPIDYHWSAMRAMRIIRPNALVLIEGELWPNIIRCAKRNSSAIILANGRVSDATYHRALTYGQPFYRTLLRQFDALLMRTEIDAQRIISIGAEESKVHITGDIKLDVHQLSNEELELLRKELLMEFGIPESSLVWVAGSTHQGEEELLLEVYKRLLIHFPTLRLIIAPRHIERSSEVAALIARNRFWCVRRSSLLHGTIEPKAISMATATPVFLLDTMGELKRIYAMSTVAFVGGSLVKRGGHNVIEPLAYGCPVVFGKHVDNFRPHAAVLQSEGVGFVVSDADELFGTMLKLLSSQMMRTQIRWRSKKLLQAHSGAAFRTAMHIAKLIAAQESRP